MMRENSAARFCAVQSVSILLSIGVGKSLTSLSTMLKFEKKRDSVNFARMIALSGAPNMKNVYEVLRQKEMELTRLEKEVEALRLVAPLLSEEKEMNSDMMKPTLATAVNGPQQPIRIPAPQVTVPAAQPVRAAGWDDSAKRWP